MRDHAIMRTIGSNRPVFGRTSHCNRERRTHLFGGRILLGPLRAFREAAGKSVGRGGSTSVASPLFLAISRSTMVVVSMRRPRGQDEGLRRCDLSHAERRLFHSQTGGVLPLRSFCNPWGGTIPTNPEGRSGTESVVTSSAETGSGAGRSLRHTPRTFCRRMSARRAAERSTSNRSSASRLAAVANR